MPFFPDRASTFAPHVDALYIFLVLLSAFFSLLIGSLVVVFGRMGETLNPGGIEAW